MTEATNSPRHVIPPGVDPAEHEQTRHCGCRPTPLASLEGSQGITWLHRAAPGQRPPQITRFESFEASPKPKRRTHPSMVSTMRTFTRRG